MDETERPAARADLQGGLFWIALGAIIVVASWRMDRLERLGVSFYTAPGLLPGILGVLVLLCGTVLAARALRGGALEKEQRLALLLNRDTLKRVAMTLVLCLGFAIGLVGHGLPFWAAAALYLFAQMSVLEYPKLNPRRLAVLAGIALGAAAAISFVFQNVFLVRLP